MKEEFVEILSRYTGLDAGAIGPDLLLARYCYDLDLVEMAMILEDEFGVAIPNEMLEGPLTAGELWAYISEAL
ncbi:MAG: hypothetical protein IKD62_07170 [Oscillospiraceae bacterium]|nr:hypothetical protein [Oscillospiraceae bacterium]